MQHLPAGSDQVFKKIWVYTWRVSPQHSQAVVTMMTSTSFVIFLCVSLSVSIVLSFQPMLVSDKDRIEGVWNPVLDDDAEKPLLQKSLTSLTRSQLPCDFSKEKHWCQFQHFMTCLRPQQLTNNTTSIAFLTAGGRLGNAMSTYSSMLALR